MINPESLALGTKRNTIMELADYGRSRAAVIGKENVFDFSIGNPSVPAPGAVHDAIIEIMEKQNSVAVHGYTAATGTVDVRKTVADDLNARYGTKIRFLKNAIRSVDVRAADKRAPQPEEDKK